MIGTTHGGESYDRHTEGVLTHGGGPMIGIISQHTEGGPMIGIIIPQ